MSTSIRVDEATKDKLERLKHDDETWSEFLERLAAESGTMNAGVWDSERAEAAREVIRKSRESFERHE